MVVNVGVVVVALVVAKPVCVIANLVAHTITAARELHWHLRARHRLAAAQTDGVWVEYAGMVVGRTPPPPQQPPPHALRQFVV